MGQLACPCGAWVHLREARQPTRWPRLTVFRGAPQSPPCPLRAAYFGSPRTVTMALVLPTRLTGRRVGSCHPRNTLAMPGRHAALRKPLSTVVRCEQPDRMGRTVAPARIPSRRSVDDTGKQACPWHPTTFGPIKVPGATGGGSQNSDPNANLWAPRAPRPWPAKPAGWLSNSSARQGSRQSSLLLAQGRLAGDGGACR